MLEHAFPKYITEQKKIILEKNNHEKFVMEKKLFIYSKNMKKS